MRRDLPLLLTVIALAIAGRQVTVLAEDWPTFMHDRARSGITGEALAVSRGTPAPAAGRVCRSLPGARDRTIGRAGGAWRKRVGPPLDPGGRRERPSHAIRIASQHCLASSAQELSGLPLA